MTNTNKALTAVKNAAAKVRQSERGVGLATVRFAVVVTDALVIGVKQSEIVTATSFSKGYVSNMALAGEKLAVAEFSDDDSLAIVNTAAGKQGDRKALKAAETEGEVIAATTTEKQKSAPKSLAEQLLALVEKVDTEVAENGSTPELDAAVERSLKTLTVVARMIVDGSAKVA